MDSHKVLEQDMSVPAKLTIGGAGVGMGFIDHIVNWAQVISVVGGSIIVMITLAGMCYRGFKKLTRR